jgi:hypothetical protein
MVQNGYGEAQAIDDIMSRLETIGDGTNTNAAYKYLGAGDIVAEDFVQAGVKLNLAANNLAGLDRFGRVIDQAWADYGSTPETLTASRRPPASLKRSGNAGWGVSLRSDVHWIKFAPRDEVHIVELMPAARAGAHAQNVRWVWFPCVDNGRGG